MSKIQMLSLALFTLILSACSGTSITNVEASPTTGGSSNPGTSIAGQGSTVAGSNTGGSSSTGGSGTVSTCVPKTCEEVAAAADAAVVHPLSPAQACGTVDDGCGGSIECGSCTDHGVFGGTANTDCSQSVKGNISANLQISWASYGLTAVPNICGSRCVRATAKNPDYGDCGTYVWICPSSVGPAGCTNNVTTGSFSGTVTTWCCA
jgi:hypothetical protein